MKKWIGAIVITGVLVSGSTMVFAAENEKDVFNFVEMLPFMQEMHPDMSTNELQDMYTDCHGTGGSSQSENFENTMMPNNMINNL
ncbi:hypothetical protein RZN22_13190 [Bacillaceae bacterium S4-13-58]